METFMFIGLMILFSAFAYLLIFDKIIPTLRQYHKVTTIRNHNMFMTKFIYKVDLSELDIFCLLNQKRADDDLSCSFDYDRRVITFSYNTSAVEYSFQIQKQDGYSLFRLEQIDVTSSKTAISYKLNPFIVGKLRAELIPYFKADDC